MNYLEIYKDMRIYENILRMIKEKSSELKEYVNGRKEIIQDDPFSLQQDTVENRTKEIENWIKQMEKEKERIESSLYAEGIDVEYVVKNVYHELKEGTWLHNYYIQQNKLENAGYEYKTYEGEVTAERERKTYMSLKAAVEEILSYYDYLTDIETVDEAMEKVSKSITVRGNVKKVKYVDPLSRVYTSSEAEYVWELSEGTIRQACTRGKLKKHIGKGVKQSGKVWLVSDDVMHLEYGKKVRENIEQILNGWFKFKSWSSYHRDSRDFENNLQEFGKFKVYDSFKAFLLDNVIYLEDEEGQLRDVEEILNDKDTFDNFINDTFIMSNFFGFTYENILESFLFGEADATEAVEPNIYFEFLDDVKTEGDVLMFINDVLRDLGEVTHTTGTRNQYEVVGIAE